MPVQSSAHAYVNWAKERLDEMDAALASIETQGARTQAESKLKVDQLVTELETRRNAFAAEIKKQSQAGEAAWAKTKTELEARWSAFDAQVKTYIESLGKQVEQKQATFRGLAAAQLKAWQHVAEDFQREMTALAAEKRADMESAIKRMKAEAAEAEARLQKVQQAGTESWASLTAALAESRKAFDHANQAAADAFRRAVLPNQ